MLPLLIFLIIVGLAGGYWLLHSNAVQLGLTAFLALAGLGVFLMFLLIGLGFLTNPSSSSKPQRKR